MEAIIPTKELMWLIKRRLPGVTVKKATDEGIHIVVGVERLGKREMVQGQEINRDVKKRFFIVERNGRRELVFQ